MIVRVPKARFDALAGYIRGPQSFLISQELEWYMDEKARVIGVLAMDIIDGDFLGTVLGRDARGRFRCVTMTPFCETPDAARALLQDELDRWLKMPEAEFWQGD